MERAQGKKNLKLKEIEEEDKEGGRKKENERGEDLEKLKERRI